MQALYFLLDLAGKVVVGLFLLRFFMQLTRANFRNPIASAIVKFTNPLVLPLRGVLVSAVLTLLQASISLYVLLVFFGVLLSWFNRDPYNPLAGLVGSLTEPLLAPARRLIPPIGGLDLSPILVLVALQALSILVQTSLRDLLL